MQGRTSANAQAAEMSVKNEKRRVRESRDAGGRAMHLSIIRWGRFSAPSPLATAAPRQSSTKAFSRHG
jgi:hypothetical protein